MSKAISALKNANSSWLERRDAFELLETGVQSDEGLQSMRALISDLESAICVQVRQGTAFQFCREALIWISQLTDQVRSSVIRTCGTVIAGLAKSLGSDSACLVQETLPLMCQLCTGNLPVCAEAAQECVAQLIEGRLAKHPLHPIVQGISKTGYVISHVC